MSEEKPKLRQDLEVIPSNVRGQRIFIIRDPLGLVDMPIVVGQQAVELLRMLDGSNTVSDIEVAMVRGHGGMLMPAREVEKTIKQFDSLFLLENERYRKARKTTVDDFLSAEVREPCLAGKSYPADSLKLAERLDSILALLTHHGKPGRELVGLVAPHIDFDAGARGYCAAYQRVYRARFDLVVILGTGHSMANGLFCLTEKDFKTPFGIARTNREIVKKLRAAGGGCVIEDDLPHRREHSIELQLVFLQHVLESRDFEIVPILCGSFAGELKKCSRASEIEGVAPLLDVLKDVVKDSAGKVLVVAGVDLSHVGPKFGDDRAGAMIIPESQEHDEALLDALCRQDAAAFWAESKGVEDRYHVCGFSALACMLEVLPRCDTRVLLYDTWHEGPTMSAVSFAAAAFTAQPPA